jgi:hypothetical protein
MSGFAQSQQSAGKIQSAALGWIHLLQQTSCLFDLAEPCEHLGAEDGPCGWRNRNNAR